MNLISLVLVVCVQTAFVSGDCFVDRGSNHRLQPFLARELGSEKILLPDTTERVTFAGNERIKLICPQGFRAITVISRTREEYNYRYSYDEQRYECNLANQTSLSLYCNNENSIIIENALQVGKGDPVSNMKFYSGPIWCKSESYFNIMEGTNTDATCAKHSLAVGINFDETPIVLADACIDLKKFRTEYVHFVLGERSPFLSQQADLNSLNETITSSSFGAASRSYSRYFLSQNELNEKIKAKIGSEYEVPYIYAPLIPDSTFMPHFSGVSEYLTNTTINRAIWWNSLLNGNWMKFQKLLNARSSSINYDVYLGVSGTVSAPVDGKDGNMEKLKFKSISTQSVPEYIWSYIKSRDENTAEEFVVVGYNSPFLEYFPRNETVFCEDICHKIDWLQPMEKIRKISAFGYVFCCEVSDEVKMHLDGFPKIETVKKTTAIEGIRGVTPTSLLESLNIN